MTLAGDPTSVSLRFIGELTSKPVQLHWVSMKINEMVHAERPYLNDWYQIVSTFMLFIIIMIII